MMKRGVCGMRKLKFQACLSSVSEGVHFVFVAMLLNLKSKVSLFPESQFQSTLRKKTVLIKSEIVVRGALLQ